MISFQSKEEHIAALYDACGLIVDTYRQSNLLDVYDDNNLMDGYNLMLTCQEILGLIAEGEIK